MNEAPENRSLGSLVSDLTEQATTLVRTETRLLRAELSEKMTKIGASAVELIAGAVCLMAALVILLQALVIALANAGLGAGWSSLLVGLGVAALGVILLRNGKSGFDADELSPDRTTRQVKKDADVLKEQMK